MPERKPRQLGATEGYDPEFVRDVSEAVYSLRLDDENGAGEAERMRVADAKAKGTFNLRARAASYDALTRTYLAALGIQKPEPIE